MFGRQTDAGSHWLRYYEQKILPEVNGDTEL